MTPTQVYVLGAVGGMSAIVGLILFILLSLAFFTLSSRLIEARAAHRERRRNLNTCRAIDALGTTNHPTDK